MKLISSLVLMSMLSSAAYAQTGTQCVTTALAGGTGDAITVPRLPCTPTTTLLTLVISNSNTVIAPTLTPQGSPSLPIVNADGSPLGIGVLKVGFHAMLQSNGSKWFWLNGAAAAPISSVGFSNAVTDCGAVGDGATDDFGALQACINNLAVTGGEIVFPVGYTFKIGSTLNVGNGSVSGVSSRRGVVLRGLGNSATLNFQNINTPGTPAINFTGTGAAIQINGPLQGWSIHNLYISCSTPGSNSGLRVISGQFGDVTNLSVANCFYGVYSSTVASIPSGLGNADSIFNTYDRMFLWVPNDGYGMYMTGNANPSIPQQADTDFNKITNVFTNLQNAGATAIYWGFADSNVVSELHPFGASGSVANKFDYSLFVGFPSSIIVNRVTASPTTVTAVNIGTPNTHFPNYLNQAYTTNNAGNYPGFLTNLLVDKSSWLWTPTLAGATTAGTPTYSIQTGTSEISGYLAVAHFYINISATGGMAGNLQLRGLPVPAQSVPADAGPGCFITSYSGIDLLPGYTQLMLQIDTGTSNGTFYQSGDNQAAAYVPASAVSNLSLVVGTCVYHID